jgi:hypothetical protein
MCLTIKMWKNYFPLSNSVSSNLRASIDKAASNFGWQVTTKKNPCGGGVEYLHRDPASRKRRRNGTKKAVP